MKKIVLLALFGIFNIQQVFSQNVTVSGSVTGVSGEPLQGISVVVKGTTSGVASDSNGNYSLKAPDGSILVFSCVGFVTQEVEYSGQSPLNVAMVEESVGLDEVVVVGYGVQKKRDLTGAVSSIKLEDTPVATLSNIGHAMAGKASGLRVTQNSAQVGGGSKFRIRGETSINAGNDPLIIIDGFPVTSASNLGTNLRYSNAGSTDNLLESLNPNDIASIEILKDASSTAIYGSRAGHGVIIVTTKRGRQGQMKVNYSGNVSVQNMKNGYDMLNSKEYFEHWNKVEYERYLQKNGLDIYAAYSSNPTLNPAPFAPRYSDAQIAAAQTTDYFKEVTRTGIQNSHNLSMTGGSENTQYMASINYFDQQGVIKNNNMERLTANVNLDRQVSKYMKTGISFNISRNRYDNVPLGDAEWENSGIIVSAVRFAPYVPVRDADGKYSLNPDMTQTPNPVSLLEIKDNTTKDRMLGTAYLQIEPVKNLLLKVSLGADRKYAKRKSYLPTTTLAGAASNGSAFITEEDRMDYLMDLTANYNLTFGSHNITALAGYSYQQFNVEGFSAGNSDFPIDGFFYNNLGVGNYPKPSVGSWASKSALGSYFGRVNYSFRGKYLLTATIRADGDSDFNPDYRWGYFPSASIGWRFSDENFMQALSGIVSNGKLRVGYGQTGNSNVGNQIWNSYGAGTGFVFGENGSTGVNVTRLGNPALTWETTSEYNIGLDLGFVGNRINVSLEYYDRTISDLLVTAKSLLSYHEITKMAANIGKTRGKGFEVTLNTVNISSDNLYWSSDLTVSTYKDRWEERDPEWKPAVYQQAKDPIRPIYRYRADGLMAVGETAPAWQPALLPGQIKLKNLADEEGKENTLNQYDQEFIGSEDPAFSFGFNNTLRYKNFDFNIYFYGEVGRWRGESYYDNWVAGMSGNNFQNLSRGTFDSWFHDNRNTRQPSVLPNTYANRTNDYWLKKISYIRCRNITLGYTVPVSKKIVNSIRVYADVNNPFVITNWNGVDPETDNDRYAYPNVTSFSFGIDISF
ncbi:MAG: TonB-dependent receptor [Prevotellaceae bacterium]|jgi:TonB-linked SusC/RagA family outer membrane protein|nr:TonB-dependent receptor [Prevotellaceae bacterium]